MWGIFLLLETTLSPLVAVIRVHLNEKAIVHCNLLLMEKANSIESLTPVEDPKLYDQIQFLKLETTKRPLNFVFLINTRKTSELIDRLATSKCVVESRHIRSFS